MIHSNVLQSQKNLFFPVKRGELFYFANIFTRGLTEDLVLSYFCTSGIQAQGHFTVVF